MDRTRALRRDHLAHIHVRVADGPEKGQVVIWHPRTLYRSDRAPWVTVFSDRRYASHQVVSDAERKS